MALTQQEIDKIDQSIDEFLGTLGEFHSYVQLFRDLSSASYRLRERFTRQRLLAVNTLLSSIREEIEFFFGLTTDLEVKTAIELITTNVEGRDCREFIADSRPDRDGYDGYSS